MGDPAELLQIGLGRLGLDGSVASEAADRLARLAHLVAEWASRIQLTADRTPTDLMQNRVLDAVALSTQLPNWDSLADLGSGAGFPGLPLACLYPEREVLLIESREKRHYFQKMAIRELDLPRTRAIRGRAESLQPTPCEVALAQAVAPPDEAMALLQPWVSRPGWMAIPLSDRQVAPLLPKAECEVRSYETATGKARQLWLARLSP